MDLFLKIVSLGLSGKQDKENHLRFLRLLKLLKDIIKVDTLSKAVPLCYSENSSFESDFIISIYYSSPKSYSRYAFHKNRPKFINARLRTCKKGSSEFFFTRPYNCKILSVVINFLPQVIHPFFQIVIILPSIWYFLLNNVKHWYRITHIRSWLVLPNLI